MKFIISLLLFPAISIALTAWGCLAFYRYGINDPLAAEFTSKAHTFKAFMYMAMGIGMPAAVVSTLAGAALVVLSFIFKSWIRACVAGAVAFGSGYIWWYFLTVDYPA